MVNGSKQEGIVQTLTDIRNGTEDSVSRRERRDYQKYIEKMRALSSLSRFSYEEFDYAPYLEREEFVPLPMPDYSDRIAEAEKKTKAESSHIKPLLEVSAVVVFCIFVDTFLDFAGILSVMSLAGAGVVTHGVLQKRRKAIATAIEKAKIEVKRLQTKFKLEIERAHQNFNREQEERIRSIQEILSGAPWAILEACELAASLVEVPFLLRGRIELFGKEPVIWLKLPDDEFVPTL